MDAQRKRLIGQVVSDKMDKTIVVMVQRTRRHPLYGKVIRINKRYKVHDEGTVCRVGDEVRIIESRPYSKDTRFCVEEILKRAVQVDRTPLQAEGEAGG